MIFYNDNDMVTVSSFGTPHGASEWHVMARTERGLDVPEEMDRLWSDCESALSAHGLSDDTLVFTRFYLSDPPNQCEYLAASKVYAHALSGAVSAVRQCPAEGGSVAMYAYHVRGRNGADRKSVV